MLFSASVSCSFISTDSNNTTIQHSHTMRATTCGGRVCVYVCVCVCVRFDSGTAAHKVSLISWQQAHWTTDRELNLLLMKLCSNTSRQNCSTVLLWLLPRCLLVFVRTRFTPGFSPAIIFLKSAFFLFFLHTNPVFRAKPALGTNQRTSQ